MAYIWTPAAVSWLVGQVKANRTKLDKLHTALDLTLPVSGWSDGRQTISAPGVTATNMVVVTVDRWGVQCVAQGAGTLTFSYSVKPSKAVTAHISIHNDL